MRRHIAGSLWALFLVGEGLARAGGAGVGGPPSWIAGGQEDPSTSAVVGVIDLVSGTMADLCSGVLLAPNAVLTARHCVSAITGEMSGNVRCDSVTVGAPRPADHFFVTTDATFPQSRAGYHAVREVVIPEGGSTALCGNDVAVLVLADDVTASVAAPLVPATDEPKAGQGYSAVGYGGTDDQGAGVGTRRRRDGLAVRCDGERCGAADILAGEFAGGAGVCAGDSGGPALDGAARVLGIASRGGSGCSTSVYLSAPAQLSFLRGAVRHAAELAGESAPAWTSETTTPTTSDSGGCHVGARRRARAAWPLAALLLGLPLARILRERSGRRQRRGAICTSASSPK